jgi:hypothetical protein
VARAQAVALVRKYYAVQDGILQPPHYSLNELYLVAMDQNYMILGKAYQGFLGKDYTQTGRTAIVKITPGVVSLAYQPKASPRVLPTVHVTACVRVSDVVLRDAKGRSLVPRNRKPYLVDDLTVKNYGGTNPRDWRVSADTNREADSCAGS